MRIDFATRRSFPLTPALSPRERENRSPVVRAIRACRFVDAPRACLPLPEGEGRGEGEQRVVFTEALHLGEHTRPRVFRAAPSRVGVRRPNIRECSGLL